MCLCLSSMLRSLQSDANSRANWSAADALYVSLAPCDTGLLVGATCKACPAGGYCPGGGRVWPLPGYWSFDETALPQPCALPQACPGALSDPQTTANGQRLTSLCAEGYSGVLCTDCTSGYFLSSQACVSCGLQSTERMELFAVLFVAVGLFLSMAVAVATLSARGLTSVVSSLLLMQHLSVVGKLGGSQVASGMPWVTELFTVLSMLNFDLQFVKPGCVVASMSFLTVYWVTLGVLGLTSLLFVGSAAIRATRLGRGRGMPSSMSESAPPAATVASSSGSSPSTVAPLVMKSLVTLPWRARFDARLIHAQLILGSAVYLRLTTMTLQALQCQPVVLEQGAAPTLVLAIDFTTPCYRGAHLLTAVLAAWPVMFLYCIGFPLLAAAILYRSFHTAAKRALLSSVLGKPSVDMADTRKGTTAAAAAARQMPVLRVSSFSDSNLSALPLRAAMGRSSLASFSPSHTRLSSVARAAQPLQQAPLVGRHVESSSASGSVCASPRASSRHLSPISPKSSSALIISLPTDSGRATPNNSPPWHMRSVGMAAVQPAVIRECEVEMAEVSHSGRASDHIASSTPTAVTATDEDMLAFVQSSSRPTAAGDPVSPREVLVGDASQPFGSPTKNLRRPSSNVRQALRDLSKDLKRQEQFGSEHTQQHSRLQATH